MNDLMGSLIAMAGPAGAGSSKQQSPAFMIIWMGLMIGVFYFLMIRPQKRREKEKRVLLESAKSGDRVVFGGGMLGIIANVKDKTFVIKVAENVKIEVARYAVTQILDKGEELSAEAEKK
jgi:preprotein translocase subunit YajC